MAQQTMDQPTTESPQLVRYSTDRGEVALSVKYAQQYFCPAATTQEAFAFIQLCRFHRLNPYLREAYLVKYGKDNAAQFIIGYQAWTQRADKDSNYDGFSAGIILAKGDQLEYRPSAFYQAGEQIAGGWCEVRLKHRSQPVRIEVAFQEYVQKTSQGQPNRFWSEKPATMIRKVAVAQAHREAFPRLFAGLYDEAELNSDGDLPTDAVVVEGTGTWLEDVDPTTGEIFEAPAQPEGDPPLGASDYPKEQAQRLRDYAFEIGLDLAGITKALGPKWWLQLNHDSEEPTRVKLREAAGTSETAELFS